MNGLFVVFFLATIVTIIMTISFVITVWVAVYALS
jgi:hypothetical protein